MARRLRYSASARKSLDELADYLATASGGSLAAKDFLKRLRQKARHLASLPGTLGRARPELRLDLRSFAFKGYIIFFRYVGDDIFEIVDVIDGRRDIDSLFSED